MRRLNQRETLSAYEAVSIKGREKNINKLMNLAELLEVILDNIYSGIIFCDTECNVIYINNVFAELLGVDQENALGTKITDYFPDSRLPNVLQRGISEFGIGCEDKEHKRLIVNRIPIKIGGETIGVVLQSIHKDYNNFKELMIKFNKLEQKIDFYEKGFSARYSFDDIKGESKRIQEAKKNSLKFAKSDAPVLITGPTGTGKELFAHAIHKASQRSKGPFICLNCAAIPRELLESELFGYEPGAFTGAKQKVKPGKIELAQNGTLFLDEIGDLPPSAQAKLLRVIETKIFERLGGLKTIKVDFRLISATNKVLKDLIARNRFREDLFYRLNSMAVEIPPLHERIDDLPILIDHFLKNMGRSTHRVNENAERILKNYPWPGNIRELKNIIERAVSLAESNVIDVDNLPWEMTRVELNKDLGTPKSTLKPLAQELLCYEKKILSQALTLTDRNISKCAKLLNISRSTLYEKCNRYNL